MCAAAKVKRNSVQLALHMCRPHSMLAGYGYFRPWRERIAVPAAAAEAPDGRNCDQRRLSSASGLVDGDAPRHLAAAANPAPNCASPAHSPPMCADRCTAYDIIAAMPSPIGHALGGIAAGALVARRPGWRALALFALAGALPDIDFLLPIQHRGPSHSIGAAVMAGGATLMILGFVRRPLDRVRLAAAIALAYASHTLLDWLGADSSTPRGLMALWPLSSAYYVSDWDVFAAVSRRYWLPGFVEGTVKAVLRELVILVPAAALAWWVSRRRQ